MSGEKKWADRACEDCGCPNARHHAGICGQLGCSAWQAFADSQCPSHVRREAERRAGRAERMRGNTRGRGRAPRGAAKRQEGLDPEGPQEEWTRAERKRHRDRERQRERRARDPEPEDFDTERSIKARRQRARREAVYRSRGRRAAVEARGEEFVPLKPGPKQRDDLDPDGPMEEWTPEDRKRHRARLWARQARAEARAGREDRERRLEALRAVQRLVEAGPPQVVNRG